MQIKINDKYRIKSLNSDNIAIQLLGEDKEGNPRWDNVSYYNHLSSALCNITDSARFVHDCKNMKDLKAHLDRIDEIKKEFKSILCS